MKFLAPSAVVLSSVVNVGNGFILPSGLVARDTHPDSRIYNTITYQFAPGDSCFFCARSVKNRPSTDPCCSSRGVRRRLCCPKCTHGTFSVRMQACGPGCGCVGCATSGRVACATSGRVDYATIRHSHKGSLHNCPLCFASGCGESCECPICLQGGGRSTLMMMKAGNGQVPESLPEAVTVLRQRLAQEPLSVTFDETLTAIAKSYDYTPRRFVNDGTSSEAGTNAGSCKVFSFGKIEDLSPEEVLACFGEHFRSVIANPSGEDHGNIRAFMKTGWEGIEFPDGLSLTAKGD